LRSAAGRCPKPPEFARREAVYPICRRSFLLAWAQQPRNSGSDRVAMPPFRANGALHSKLAPVRPLFRRSLLPKARATSGVQPPEPRGHLRHCGRKTPHLHHCPRCERSATRTTVGSGFARRPGEVSIRLIGTITRREWNAHPMRSTHRLRHASPDVICHRGGWCTYAYLGPAEPNCDRAFFRGLPVLLPLATTQICRPAIMVVHSVSISYSVGSNSRRQPEDQR
jgi:hypothetical protein